MNTVDGPSARKWFNFSYIKSLNRIFVLGGFTSADSQDSYSFDIDTNRWTKLVSSGVDHSSDGGQCSWTGTIFFCNGGATPFLLAP